jgi:hypothetical protein
VTTVLLQFCKARKQIEVLNSAGTLPLLKGASVRWERGAGTYSKASRMFAAVNISRGEWRAFTSLHCPTLSNFDEYTSANVHFIARHFRVRHLRDENKTTPIRGAECDFLRHGNQRYRDEFSQSVRRKWPREDGGAGPGGSPGSAPDGTEVEVLHPSLAP